jgi:stage II sporulation protein D
VLLAAGRRSVRIGCAGGISVTDASGRGHALPAGWYSLGRTLALPVGQRRVRVHVRRGARRGVRTRVVTVRRSLRPPLVFDCPSSPLELGGSTYHGLLVVRRAGRNLDVVDNLPLEQYVQGVVGSEMPSRWRFAALEAQAVAARTYALATLKPTRGFDLYADTRSQVYGGIASETARTDLAVERTTGRVVLWHGLPADTFFFSTSGGRTAAIRDVWPRAAALPYLRSVADPYEAGSPHRTWRVAVTPAQLRARLHLVRPRSLAVSHSGSGRARAVSISGRRIAATAFQAALHLGSTWFDVGELQLRATRGRLAAAGRAAVVGSAVGVGRARLQERAPNGRWQTIERVGPGAFWVRVSPRRTTEYRLAVRGVAAAPVTVAVPGRRSSRTLATAHR